MKYNAFKAFWGKYKILKKVLTFTILLAICIGLPAISYFSPDRVKYTDDQLETEQSFANGSGDMNLVSQTYSTDNGIIVLEFDTSDSTTSVKSGITASNLEWQLFAKDENSTTEMTILPITETRIDVVIRYVPTEFDVLVVGVTNHTPVNDDVDVNIDDSSDSSSGDSSPKKKDENENSLLFYITPQNDQLKKKKITYTSRESFALNSMEAQKSYLNREVKKLNTSIEKINESMDETKGKLETKQDQEQYHSGEDLEEWKKDEQELQNEIDTAQDDIDTANANINELNGQIDTLNKAIEAIKNGTYDFGSTVSTVKMGDNMQ
ncbi:hypothetical protein [Streptococcus dentiloxodontae]